MVEIGELLQALREELVAYCVRANESAQDFDGAAGFEKVANDQDLVGDPVVCLVQSEKGRCAPDEPHRRFEIQTRLSCQACGSCGFVEAFKEEVHVFRATHELRVVAIPESKARQKQRILFKPLNKWFNFNYRKFECDGWILL